LIAGNISQSFTSGENYQDKMAQSTTHYALGQLRSWSGLVKKTRKKIMSRKSKHILTERAVAFFWRKDVNQAIAL